MVSGDSPTPPSNVARATSQVATATLASRVLGLLRDTLTAGFFGAGPLTDAFFVAFKIPNLLRRLFAEGALSAGFVPIFSEAVAQGPKDAVRVFNAVVSGVLLVVIPMLLIGLLFAPEITVLFAPGLGAEEHRLAWQMLAIMLPYVLFVSLLSVVSSALNALGYFGRPALSPAILNIVLIVLMISGRQLFEPQILIIPIGVVLGGLLTLIYVWLPLQRQGYRLCLTKPWRHTEIPRLLRLMMPALLAASGYQVMVFINTLLASFLPDGSISWLYYADRLFQFPLGVFSLAIATAILPTLARHSAQMNESAFASDLLAALRWVSFISVPASVGLMLYSEEIIRTVYQRGSFDERQTIQTAKALVAYSIGLWGISCQSILVRAFIAKKETRIPALVTIGTLGCNLLLACLTIGPIPQKAMSTLGEQVATVLDQIQLLALGHSGLALAASIATTLGACLLYGIMTRMLQLKTHRVMFQSLSKTVAATAGMTLMLSALQTFSDSIFLGIPCGILTYAVLSLLLKSTEAIESRTYLRKLFPRTVENKF